MKTKLEIYNALNKVVNKNRTTYEIFNLTLQGCHYRSIAQNLGIAESTVCSRLNALCKELGLRQSVHGGDVNGILDHLLYYVSKDAE